MIVLPSKRSDEDSFRGIFLCDGGGMVYTRPCREFGISVELKILRLCLSVRI